MNGHFDAAIAAMDTAFLPCLIAALAVDTLILLKFKKNIPIYWTWYTLYQAIMMMLKMADGKPAWSHGLGMTLGIVLLHLWWKRRPPRKKKRKKVSERIKVRLGRLVVVPT